VTGQRQREEGAHPAHPQDHGRKTPTSQQPSKQRKKKPTNQLFSHQSTVPSNPSSAGPQAAHGQPPSPHPTSSPTAPRRSTEGWARSSQQSTSSSLLVRGRRWPLPDTCETGVVVVVGEGGRRCGALPGGWLAFFLQRLMKGGKEERPAGVIIIIEKRAEL